MAVKLEVQPEQRLFVPIVAVCLAKAYIKPGDGIVIPYGIYPGDTMVGFFAITHDAIHPDSF